MIVIEFIEVWVPVLNYEGLYEVSNYGRVRSLDNLIAKPRYSEYIRKGRVLQQTLSNGYPQVTLYRGTNHKKPTPVHLISFYSFNTHIIKSDNYEVDHIDNNPMNTMLSNFQLLTSRENSAKRSFQKTKTSKYTGVSWDKQRNKWFAHIRYKNKTIGLGRHLSEYDAHLAYQAKLIEINNAEKIGNLSSTPYYLVDNKSFFKS